MKMDEQESIHALIEIYESKNFLANPMNIYPSPTDAVYLSWRYPVQHLSEIPSLSNSVPIIATKLADFAYTILLLSTYKDNV